VFPENVGTIPSWYTHPCGNVNVKLELGQKNWHLYSRQSKSAFSGKFNVKLSALPIM